MCILGLLLGLLASVHILPPTVYCLSIQTLCAYLQLKELLSLLSRGLKYFCLFLSQVYYWKYEENTINKLY